MNFSNYSLSLLDVDCLYFSRNFSPTTNSSTTSLPNTLSVSFIYFLKVLTSLTAKAVGFNNFSKSLKRSMSITIQLNPSTVLSTLILFANFSFKLTPASKLNELPEQHN